MANAKKENEFKLDDKVTVISIAPWNTNFSRLTSIGEVSVTASGTVRLSREEIIAQVNNNNKLFNGMGNGAHATYYIDDAETRKYLEFETDDVKQKVVNKETVAELFKIEKYEDFVNAVKDLVVTRAEKQAFIKIVISEKYNEYDKVSFAREHCRFSFKYNEVNYGI